MPAKVPKLCHFKPRNLACVWITPTRRLYLGPWGSPESRERYAEVVRRLLLGLEVTEAPDLRPTERRATLAIGDLTTRYLDHVADYHSKNGEPTAEHRKVASALRGVKERYGEVPAGEFGPLCLEDVRDQMIDSGLARTTINDQTRRIVAMFKWAAARELVPPTVHHGLTMVSGLRTGRTRAPEPVPVRPVEDDVVDATIRELPQVVADMVRFQRLTGARPTEVCLLRPCDLDRDGDVWRYKPARHKTQHHGKDRTILIGPKAQAILLRYLARDPEAYCFRPCDSEAKRLANRHASRKTPISCGNRPGTNRKPSPIRVAGGRYTKDSYARAIVRAAERAKVERWTPNQLRHTYATAVRRDHGLEAAQILLGHSGARVTEIYAERDQAKGAAVARLIG